MGTVIPLPRLKSFDDSSVPWGSNSGSWTSLNPSFSVPPTRQAVSSRGLPPLQRGRHKVYLPGIVLVYAAILPSLLIVCHFIFKKFSLHNNLYSHILCDTYLMLQLYTYSLFFKSHSTPSSAPCSHSPLSLGYPFLPYFSDEILFILKNQRKCYHLSVFWPVSPASLPYSTALFIPSSMFPESHPFLVQWSRHLHLGVICTSVLGVGPVPCSALCSLGLAQHLPPAGSEWVLIRLNAMRLCSSCK